MKGGFSMSATEPNEGVKQGNLAGTELAMHAHVVIDDMERFVADRDHLGGLSGSIDYPPLAMGIPSVSGVFNLFYPTDDPELKLMVYELGFELNGESYYLAGKKEVRDDPGFDLWSDTTTLYTQLHQGVDKSGPVVGAGVLTLGVTDLIKLVSTIEVIDGDSGIDKAKTIATFGHFFLGELWDTYVKHA